MRYKGLGLLSYNIDGSGGMALNLTQPGNQASFERKTLSDQL